MSTNSVAHKYGQHRCLPHSRSMLFVKRAPNLTCTRPFFDLLTLATLALLMTRIPLPQLLAGGLTIQITLGSASTAFNHALLSSPRKQTRGSMHACRRKYP